MPKYKVHYTIHTAMAVDDFISGGEWDVDADNEAEAKTKAEKHVESNDPHFDPRIDPFIEIHDDWVEELEECA